ncbi:hypothetical protein [Palleronia caenipelagi]|uniref:hypothetical protein n=1 Tax=Palleronia caenipelagi TaxID=2489174 RepID=UPI00115D544F|nr:hypothetical protein [Palleronia caenipelagi]
MEYIFPPSEKWENYIKVRKYKGMSSLITAFVICVGLSTLFWLYLIFFGSPDDFVGKQYKKYAPVMIFSTPFLMYFAQVADVNRVNKNIAKKKNYHE